MNLNLLNSVLGLTLLLANTQGVAAQATAPVTQTQAQAQSQSQSQTQIQPQTRAALAGEWRQVSPDAGTLPLSLTLDGRSSFSASVGCNTLSGRYAARGRVLLTSHLSSTRMACEPQTAAAEASALERLRGLTHYALDGELLTLSGTAGDLVLRRTGAGLNLSSTDPSDSPKLTPTFPMQENAMTNPVRPISPVGHWRVRSLTAAGQSLAADPQATFTVSAEDGGGWKLAGTLGCNTFSALAQSGSAEGEWQMSGLNMTRMACSPEQAQAETALAALLGATVTVTQESGTLTLTSAAGTLVLEAAPTATPQAWADAYQGEQLRLKGQDITLTPPLTLTVTPQPEGDLRLSGNAGCNRITAAAEADGKGGWTLGRTAVTRMACKDMSAEEQVLRLLSEPTRLLPAGEGLVLRSALGELELQPVQASAAVSDTAAPTAPDSRPRLSGRYTLTELRQGGTRLDLAGFDRPVTLNFDETANEAANGTAPRFSGSDGCNSIGAGYEWDAASGKLHLTTPLVSSLAFCPSLQNMPGLAQTLSDNPAATLQEGTLTLSAGGVKWLFKRD